MKSIIAAVVVVLFAGCFCDSVTFGAPRQLPDIFKDSKPADEARNDESPIAKPDPQVIEIQTLKGRIEDLKLQLQSKRQEAFKDLGAARQRAAEYRDRVEKMKDLFYLPDPAPGSETAQVVEAFQQHWSDLARPVRDGVIPAAPLPAERWAHYAGNFEQLYCGSLPVNAPPAGMRLVGNAWACLADIFFKDLSRVAVGINRLMSAKRTKVIEESKLEDAMKLVELKLVGGRKDEPQEFVARVAELLHAVDLKGMQLRILELENRLSDNAGATPFRWFLDLSPAVRRPVEGSSGTIGVPASAKLQVLAGKRLLEATIKGLPAQTLLARELHQIHYRLALIERDGGNSDETRQARDEQETKRASVLARMSQQAQ